MTREEIIAKVIRIGATSEMWASTKEGYLNLIGGLLIAAGFEEESRQLFLSHLQKQGSAVVDAADRFDYRWSERVTKDAVEILNRRCIVR